MGEDVLYGPSAASNTRLGHLTGREERKGVVQRASLTLDFAQQLFLAESLSHE
jgi:hypothetical protein